MTDRDGGFFLRQKVFNGHLPSFSGKYLPRFALADKSGCNLAEAGCSSLELLLFLQL
jgi:hypothetical protein